MEDDADVQGGSPRVTTRDVDQDERQRQNAMQRQDNWIRSATWVRLANGVEHGDILIMTKTRSRLPVNCRTEEYPVLAVYMPSDQVAGWKHQEAESYLMILQKYKITFDDIEWYDVGEEKQVKLNETRSLITAQMLQSLIREWGPQYKYQYLSIAVVKTAAKVAVDLKGIVAAGIGGSKYAAHVAVKLGLKYSLERARA